MTTSPKRFLGIAVVLTLTLFAGGKVLAGGGHGWGGFYGHYPSHRYVGSYPYGGIHYGAHYHGHGDDAAVGLVLGFILGSALTQSHYYSHYGYPYYYDARYPTAPYGYQPRFVVRETVVPAPRPSESWASTCLQVREYWMNVTVGGKQVQAYGPACLQPDGSWKRGPAKIADYE